MTAKESQFEETSSESECPLTDNEEHISAEKSKSDTLDSTLRQKKKSQAGVPLSEHQSSSDSSSDDLDRTEANKSAVKRNKPKIPIAKQTATGNRDSKQTNDASTAKV